MESLKRLVFWVSALDARVLACWSSILFSVMHSHPRGSHIYFGVPSQLVGVNVFHVVLLIKVVKNVEGNQTALPGISFSWKADGDGRYLEISDIVELVRSTSGHFKNPTMVAVKQEPLSFIVVSMCGQVTVLQEMVKRYPNVGLEFYVF